MIPSSIAPAILTALLALGAPLGAADAHAGHDHAAHDHGKAEPIGSVAVGAYTVTASASGAIAAGAELHVELRVSPEQPIPRAIRLWVGTESGRGSEKAKAEAVKDAPGAFGAHVELPDPIPADSRLWISIESESGQATKGAIALPKAAAGHHEGDGHKH